MATNQKLNDELFEYILAYNAFNSPEYLNTILDHYYSNYFENPDVKVFMDVLVDFFTKRSAVPNKTEILALLNTTEQQKSVEIVFQKFETIDKNYNIDELYANTEKFLRKKAVTKALLKTVSDMQKQELDTDFILDEFTKACSISLIEQLGLDYFEQLNKFCDEVTKPNRVIPSGWKWLDDRIGGGFNADGKALYVFTGFTNVGKSIFLGNIALNILKQDKTVLLITLEMPEIIYAKRITSNITQVPFDIIQDKIDDVKQLVIQFKNEHNSKLIIKEFPTRDMSIHKMNAYIQKLIKKGIKPDIIIVDYINLMKNTRNIDGLYEQVKEISEQLRASTYLFGKPIITASQLNRKGAGKENPGMETTSESMGLSFTADVQLSIWTDENETALGIIHMGIQKNRFGPKHQQTLLRINYPTLTLTEPDMQPTLATNETLKNATNMLEDLNKLMTPSPAPLTEGTKKTPETPPEIPPRPSPPPPAVTKMFDPTTFGSKAKPIDWPENEIISEPILPSF